MITQDSKNSCGKAIIQQYIIYTKNISPGKELPRNYRFPSRWTTPAMIRKAFSLITERNWKRQTHLNEEKIQEYITIYKIPLPILWLVPSAKNPYKQRDEISSLHWLHYYLLIGHDAQWFIVYNPFGYEETISYSQWSHLFGFKPHPKILRKWYEKLLYRFGCIQPNMVLIPMEK